MGGGGGGKMAICQKCFGSLASGLRFTLKGKNGFPTRPNSFL